MLQDHYDDERDKIVYNKTPNLHDQEQDRFFGLRPVLSLDRPSQTTSLHASVTRQYQLVPVNEEEEEEDFA